MSRPSDEEGRREERGGSEGADVQPPSRRLLDPFSQPDEALEAEPRAEEPALAPPEAAAPAKLRAKDTVKRVGAWSEEAISLWSDREVLIAEQILAGDAGKLQRAFQHAPDTTWRMIRAAELPRRVRKRLHGTLTRMLLAAQLQPQAPAAEVRLELLAAWTWLESELKPEALVALLDEAQAHGEKGRTVVRDVLRSFSSDQLDRFLDQAAGRGRAAWEVFVAGMKDVGRRGDQIPFSRFAQLLVDVRVEEWVKEQLAQIVRERASATTVKADLAELVAELAQGASAAEAEEVSRRVYVPVLKAVEVRPHLTSGKAATEWLLAHPSAVKGDPSASDLYLCIVRTSKFLGLSGLVSEERVRDYRVQALQCLAELAPILPLKHVKEIKDELWGHFSNPAEELDEAVRQAAIAALGPIQRRLREAEAEVPVERPSDEAPSESAPRLDAPEWTSWPTSPGEAIIRFATSPRFPAHISLPVHPSLTISPNFSQTLPVPRRDASQEGLDPTLAPGLDLSAHQFPTNGRGADFVVAAVAAPGVPAEASDLAAISFTTDDPAVEDGRRNEGDGQRVIGVKEAAEILGLSQVRVRERAQEGLIGKKIGSRYLFTREELEADRRRERSKGGRPPKNPG